MINKDKSLLIRSMTEMQQRIDKIVKRLPTDQGKLLKSKAAARNVLRIMAIEEEWIIDDQLRAELTALNLPIEGDDING